MPDTLQDVTSEVTVRLDKIPWYETPTGLLRWSAKLPNSGYVDVWRIPESEDYTIYYENVFNSLEPDRTWHVDALSAQAILYELFKVTPKVTEE